MAAGVGGGLGAAATGGALAAGAVTMGFFVAMNAAGRSAVATVVGD